MRLIQCLVVLVGLVSPLVGGDFDSVIKSARQAWPERRTVIVVCNKDASSMALMDLGSATDNVVSLLVVNITATKELEKVMQTVGRKPRNEVFALLVSDDPVVGETTEAGRTLISRMTGRGIPVVGTTPAALKLGAVFAQGPGTSDKLLTNPDVAKRLGVVLPEVLIPAS